MFRNSLILLVAAFNFNVFTEATLCCKFKPEQILNNETGLPISSHNENARPETALDIGKSIILRQLVGTLAALIKYEARKENPSVELGNHVDGIVIEADTPKMSLNSSHSRRKAMLIVGEMPVQEGNSPVTSLNFTKDDQITINQDQTELENKENIESLNNNVEKEKENEKLRQQEWTKNFLKHRQEELIRRQEWEMNDTKIREDEIKRRQDWSQLIKEKTDKFNVSKSAENRLKLRDSLPANTLIQSLFEALEIYKHKNNTF